MFYERPHENKWNTKQTRYTPDLPFKQNQEVFFCSLLRICFASSLQPRSLRRCCWALWVRTATGPRWAPHPQLGSTGRGPPPPRTPSTPPSSHPSATAPTGLVTSVFSLNNNLISEMSTNYNCVIIIVVIIVKSRSRRIYKKYVSLGLLSTMFAIFFSFIMFTIGTVFAQWTGHVALNA